MNSLILKTATKFLLSLMLLFSVFILLRGHNEPGGGFIGALIASSACALYLMAHGPKKTRQLIRVDMHIMMAVGMLCALVSALLGAIFGASFMNGVWVKITLGHEVIKLGSPVLFDLGVYIVVVAAILKIFFTLEEK
jgi:multicomponent Na+:H+ antiporter subunit B